MSVSPQKIIRLIVLFIGILGAVSCNKGNDLMAEYLVSDALNPTDQAISTSKTGNATDPKSTTIADAAAQESKSGVVELSASAPQKNGTIAIDNVTNTITYTPAAENAVSHPQVAGTIVK